MYVCMCVYVCVYVCMYMYVYVYVFVYVCMYEALLYLFSRLNDARQDNNKTKVIHFISYYDQQSVRSVDVRW